VRPAFLDDVSAAETGGGRGPRTCRACAGGTGRHAANRTCVLVTPLGLDDLDDDPDDEEGFYDEDEDGEDEDEEDEEDDEEIEPWQVVSV
jgi:hypothetical protein